MSNQTIHIITVLYNSRDTFAALWDCLQRQTWTDWHTVAIDNASADGGLAMLQDINDSRLTVQGNRTNLGFAGGVNAGFRIACASGGRRCLLLNPDVFFEPDFLQALVQQWDALDAQVIAPRIMQLGQPGVSWYAGGHLETGWAFHNVHDPYKPGEDGGSRVVEFASGCCLGITTSALERVGLLDESFFVYWEDTDFCMRLNAAGILINYVENPFLQHEGGASSGGEFSTTGTPLFYRSYVQLLRKHFGMPVALRTICRLLAKRLSRPAAPTAPPASAMALAMARGLTAPLIAQARL